MVEEFRVYKDTRKEGNNGALWEVSNLGNVRKNGDVHIQWKKNSGYLAFGSCYYVHRAVAELFIPNPEPDKKTTIDHLNRIRTDNRAINLRWATPKEQAENRDNAAMVGNKHALGYRHSEGTKARMSAERLGKVWIFNPTTEQSTLINPSQLTEYLAKGYVRGREKRVWVFNPTTEHLTNINPSQLNDYLAKGYVRGRKPKK